MASCILALVIERPSPEIDVRREETTDVSVDAEAAEMMDPSFMRDDSMDDLGPLAGPLGTIGVKPAAPDPRDLTLVGLIGGLLRLSTESLLSELAPDETVSNDRCLPTRFRGSGRGGLLERAADSAFFAGAMM